MKEQFNRKRCSLYTVWRTQLFFQSYNSKINYSSIHLRQNHKKVNFILPVFNFFFLQLINTTMLGFYCLKNKVYEWECQKKYFLCFSLNLHIFIDFKTLFFCWTGPYWNPNPTCVKLCCCCLKWGKKRTHIRKCVCDILVVKKTKL